MSLTRSTFLLFLGVVVLPFCTEAQSFCSLSTNATSGNTNYTLTVNSNTLTNGTSYTAILIESVMDSPKDMITSICILIVCKTLLPKGLTLTFYSYYFTVTLSSSVKGSVQVFLQAIANSSTVGTWTATNLTSNCSVGFGTAYTFAGTSLVATWTPPAVLNVTSVNISALVSDSTAVYNIGSVTLSIAVPSTVAPNTAANATSNANSTSSTTTVSKTTSGGPTNNPTSLVLVLGLFVISSKFLS
ncbi:uncharacterized protein LOC142209092 [Leptodactylus fuscus]|uniref:uncharacterized protein LOC142209092 n=1 Tax=Leptodactylus fuscus TaxID=238119 RepID=UPI003F4F0916